MDSKQTSAALLLVGSTGSGKTSLLGTLAKHVWQKHKKITRLCTFDPGGYGDDVLALQEAGIVQVFRGYTRDPEGHLKLALETCSLATRGYWPREIDPETGAVKPGVDMVAPVVASYTMKCPAGHAVRKAKTPQQLVPTPCPTCKVNTSRENCSEIITEVNPTQGFENVGAYMFDGLTSMSEFSLSDMAFRAGQNELGGEKAAINALQSGTVKYGGTNRAAIGFVQTRAHEWVMNSLSIPGQVVPPTFTALELRATDDRTDLPIYGPKIAGQAKTAEIPQWFGNTLGTVIYPGDKGPEWRLYLQEYRMPGESAPHLCKVRTSPGVMPEFLTDAAGEEPFTSFSLGRFYELAAESVAKAKERLAASLGEQALPAKASGTVGGATPPIAKKAGEQPPTPTALPIVGSSPAAPAAIGTSPAPSSASPTTSRRAPAAAPRAKAKTAGVPSPAAPATPVEAPPPAVEETVPAELAEESQVEEERAAGAEANAPEPVEASAAPPKGSSATLAAPPKAAPGRIPPPQPNVQPPAAASASAPLAAARPPQAAPRAASAAPAAGRVPPPAGARPAPRPPAVAPVAVASSAKK